MRRVYQQRLWAQAPAATPVSPIQARKPPTPCLNRSATGRTLRLQRLAGNQAVLANLSLLNDADGNALSSRYHLLDVPPAPAHPGLHLLDRGLEEPSADRADFEAIRKMGIATSRGKRIGTLDQYLSVRRARFGAKGDSAETADTKYWAFAAESDAEFAAHKELRALIDPAPGNDQEAQASFYRWVRREFMDAGEVDVPAAIKSGMHRGEALRQIVRAEWKTLGHAERLHVEPANPRPMKSPEGRYELGTLSQHAKGNAIDIEPARNPFFSAAEWSQIELIAGTTERRDPTAWRDLWETDPRALWEKIKAINDAFVANLGARAKGEERRFSSLSSRHHLLDPAGLRAPAGAESSSPPARLSLEPPLADDSTEAPNDADWLAAAGYETKLVKFRGGFLTLDGDLVERLGKRGLLWGAVFGDRIDLQHFER